MWIERAATPADWLTSRLRYSCGQRTGSPRPGGTQALKYKYYSITVLFNLKFYFNFRGTVEKQGILVSIFDTFVDSKGHHGFVPGFPLSSLKISLFHQYRVDSIWLKRILTCNSPSFPRDSLRCPLAMRHCSSHQS